MCWCQWSISAIVMWNHLQPFYELWVINCIKNIQLAMAIPQAEPLTNEETAAILGGVGGVWVKQNKMPSASMWLCAKCEGPPLLSTQLAVFDVYLSFSEAKLPFAPAGVPDCQPVPRTDPWESHAAVPTQLPHLQPGSQAREAQPPSDSAPSRQVVMAEFL